VNKKWREFVKKGVHHELLVSKHITISDEAYAILICKQNMKKWISNYMLGTTPDKPAKKRSIQGEEENEDGSGRGQAEDELGYDFGQVKKMEDSNTEADLYFKIFKEVKEKRANSHQSVTWELGFKAFMVTPQPSAVRESGSVAGSSSVSAKISNDEVVDIEEW
jgi:hypothetical protein